MTQQKTALITGAMGGIGHSMCAVFRDAGWKVISTDRGTANPLDEIDFVAADLDKFCRSPEYAAGVISALRDRIPDSGLDVLINNAAVQIVQPFTQLTTSDFLTSYAVNAVAPAMLIQAFLTELEAADGSVVNIGSIHSRQTKSEFSAYAASKSALEGLTRSLAVELGTRIRVNAIIPAAIDTPMLSAGFFDSPGLLEKISSFHPTGSIGEPQAVGKAALYLANPGTRFLNGAILNLDGGISGKLHDPS